MATRKMHELAHMHLTTANHGETRKACFNYVINEMSSVQDCFEFVHKRDALFGSYAFM